MQSPYAKQVSKTRKLKRGLFYSGDKIKQSKLYKPNGEREVTRRVKQLEKGQIKNYESC